jgi:phospholipase/carboxylesterase/glyoxalase family protein
MPRFFRRLVEGVFDLEDLKLQTAELKRFIQAGTRQYGLQAGKIVAVGYSNGANIASSVLLTYPGLLAGAVLFRAMVPFTPQALPDLRKTSVLLSAGRRDPIAVPEQTATLAEMLEKAGASVSIHWHGGGHELGQDDVAAAKDWISKWRIPR